MKRRQYWIELVQSVLGLSAQGIALQRVSRRSQCWSVATILRILRRDFRNPNGVVEDRNASLTQGSRQAATLGLGTQPLRGWLSVRNNGNRLLRGYRALFLILVLSTCALAQNSTSIAGRVTDQNGGSVPGAEVRLRSRSGALLLATSDDNGAYSFRNVAPGDYVLEIKKSGFANFTSDGLHLTRGQSLSNDVKLSVEALSESVVVTATGTAQRTDEVSKAVTVLDGQEIEAKHEVSLAEALRGTPGLRVQQQGSPGTLTSLRLRGQRNFDTAILFDGLRVRDSADINGSAFPFISDLTPNDLDRVEILRGSGSSIYGTNAIGGVINLVPKTGAGDLRFEAGFEGGSLALFREHLKGAGGIGSRAGFSFGLTRLDVRRGVDGNDQYGNTAGAGRFQFAVTPSINITANFYGTTSNAITNNNPQPLAAATASGAQFPRAIEGVTFRPDFNNPDQGRRNAIWVGSVRLLQRVSETLSYTVAYQKVSTRRRNYNGPKLDPRFAFLSPFGDFAFNSVNNGGTDTLDARANLQIGKSNLVTAGFEFEGELLFQQSIPSFSTFNNTTNRQRTFALFVQDQIILFDRRLQISVGARAQWFRIRSEDRPGVLSNIKVENSLTGDGAVAYFIRSTGTKLRAHVGNGFRAPSLFERFGNGVFQNLPTRLGDPTLRAEQSISIDGGIDQRAAHDKLLIGITYFYTHLQRVIDFKSFRSIFNPTGDPDPLGFNRSGGYLNYPGGISRGLETFVEAAPYRGTSIRASYTYTNADRFDPQAGIQPQFVTPKHLFGLSVTQRYRAILASLSLNRTGQYIAPVFPLNFTFPGFTKADLFVSYERSLNERIKMTLFGGADNVFNERYFENGFRAPGAVGRGGVNFRF